MEKTSEIQLEIREVEPFELYGINDSKINIIKDSFPQLIITTRGNTIKIKGNKKDCQNAKAKIETLIRFLKEQNELPIDIIYKLLDTTAKMPKNSVDNGKVIVHGKNGRPIKAKTRNQRKLVDSISNHDIVFAIGPAGTGKTYLAVAMAVQALRNRLVKKIILTRPAVEAGENLGFLPGDMKDKVDPYLRPLYDALDDLIKHDRLQQFIMSRVIEVAPLAFMRGRTLDNAYVILDEAQNASLVQIKMFLTRLGPNAKCILTGDLTQIDLPKHQFSGLAKSLDILGDLDGIDIVRMSTEDVVRHKLVKKIIEAYKQEQIDDKGEKT